MKNTSQPAIDRLAFTFKEAGMTIGLSERTMAQLVTDGELLAVTIGKRSRRITKTELQRFLDEKQREGSR